MFISSIFFKRLFLEFIACLAGIFDAIFCSNSYIYFPVFKSTKMWSHSKQCLVRVSIFHLQFCTKQRLALGSLLLVNCKRLSF
jgi:hypothetical protein